MVSISRVRVSGLSKVWRARHSRVIALLVRHLRLADEKETQPSREPRPRLPYGRGIGVADFRIILNCSSTMKHVQAHV